MFAAVDLSRRLALAAVVLGLAAGCASSPAPAPAPTPTSATPDADACPYVCALCGARVRGEAIEWRSKTYHPACYERVGPHCGVCRKLIYGRHVVLAATLAYHDECLALAPRCESCGLPAAGERGDGGRWEDGRVTCRLCRSEAVLDAPDARQVCLGARNRLRELLGLDLGSVETPVVLASSHELAKRAGSLAHEGLKALTEVEERGGGDGARGERRYRIFVLYGLSRAGMRGVLAHELVHVLQAEATAAALEPALREGAANFVQVRVLRAGGDEVRAKLLEEDKDPVYGEGLRRFERLARDRGERAALEVGLRGPAFPGGY